MQTHWVIQTNNKQKKRTREMHITPHGDVHNRETWETRVAHLIHQAAEKKSLWQEMETERR